MEADPCWETRVCHLAEKDPGLEGFEGSSEIYGTVEVGMVAQVIDTGPLT